MVSELCPFLAILSRRSAHVQFGVGQDFILRRVFNPPRRNTDILGLVKMAVPAIHPGEHLAEELDELGMSPAGLARKLGVPTNRIAGILNAQHAVTGDTALRLAHFFGTSAAFRLNLQSLYDLRLAERVRR